MKQTIYSLLFISVLASSLHALSSDELMQIHKVTTAEMNNIISPQAGSLVYNTDEKTIFFYTGNLWKKMRSDGDETVMHAGSGIVVTGNGTNTSAYTIGL